MSHVMSNLEIREFNINDIEELYEVELTSFTDPWSKESFKDELNNEIADLKIDESLEIEKILQNLSKLFYPYVEEIKKDIENRDHQDMTREISPLRQAEDAVLVDSSFMNIDEVVAAILGIYKDKVE